MRQFLKRDMDKINQIDIFNFELLVGKRIPFIPLTYQIFGQQLGTAPVVVVNHALTGNSNVSGENGWWKKLVDYNAIIDLNVYTVIVFNIPGNGYCQEFYFQNYKDFTTRDIARIFWEGLLYLKVDNLFAVIGGSLGGGIAWEMAFLRPQSIQNLIPIAVNYKANDWVIANVLVQDKILNHSDDSIKEARAHAMLLYRTPQSLNLKFNESKNNEEEYEVESWINYHGVALEKRFHLASYKLMNHLLKTIGQTIQDSDLKTFFNQTKTNIFQVSIDSDGLFVAYKNREFCDKYIGIYSNMEYFEINSIHGHDAFLMEYEKLTEILKSIFKNTTKLVTK